MGLDDVELLTRPVQVTVRVSAPTRAGFFGPSTVEVRDLEAGASELTLRDALESLEHVALVRAYEVLERRSPAGLPEDRSTALPVAMKLWAAHGRGRLREELEAALELHEPFGIGTSGPMASRDHT